MKRDQAWTHLKAVARPALTLAPSTYLDSIRANVARDGIPDAVARHDTPWLFDRLIGAAQQQGISDANACAYTAKHGIVGWHDIRSALDPGPACHRLRSYWSFAECRYRKGTGTCSEPKHMPACSLPHHPARKGSLIQAAYALFLFLRDLCEDDLVGWIDRRLASVDPGPRAPDRGKRMGAALLEPLGQIYGIGNKVWSMALADILLGADPARERWVATGAAMVVIDTLMHNHLHRTGTLRRFGAEHPYGARRYAEGGCADLIRGLAERIDARAFNPTFPACFPRFVQFAVWRLCSTSELDVCNGNRIDDRGPCRNDLCPVFAACDRVALCPEFPA